MTSGAIQGYDIRMTDKPPFDEFSRAWMELMKPPSDMNEAEKDFAGVQQKAYRMVMEGMQAFATGFSERAVEHFREAASSAEPSTADAGRIEQLEARLALVEAELAALKKIKTTKRRAVKNKPTKPKT